MNAPAVHLGGVGIGEGVALAGEVFVEVFWPVVDGEFLPGTDETARLEGHDGAFAVHGRLGLGVTVAVVVYVAGDLLCPVAC